MELMNRKAKPEEAGARELEFHAEVSTETSKDEKSHFSALLDKLHLESKASNEVTKRKVEGKEHPKPVLRFRDPYDQVPEKKRMFADVNDTPIMRKHLCQRRQQLREKAVKENIPAEVTAAHLRDLDYQKSIIPMESSAVIQAKMGQLSIDPKVPPKTAVTIIAEVAEVRKAVAVKLAQEHERVGHSSQEIAAMNTNMEILVDELLQKRLEQHKGVQQQQDIARAQNLSKLSPGLETMSTETGKLYAELLASQQEDQYDVLQAKMAEKHKQIAEEQGKRFAKSQDGLRGIKFIKMQPPPLEPAYLMSSINRIVHYDLKYEYAVEHGRPVLVCDEMVLHLAKIRGLVEQMILKFRIESERPRMLKAWTAMAEGMMLHYMVLNAIRMEKRLFGKELRDGMRATLQDAILFDDAVKAAEEPLPEAGMLMLKVGDPRLQGILGQFLVLSQKTLLLPVDRSLPGLAATQKSINGRNMERYTRQKLQEMTNTHHPHDSMNSNNRQLYTDTLALARTLDSFMYENDHSDPSQSLYDTFLLRDKIEGEAAGEAFTQKLNLQEMYVKLALLMLLGNDPKNMVMREVVRASIEWWLVEAGPGFSQNRALFVERFGRRTLENACGVGVDVRTLGIAQVMDWLLEFQISRARLTGDVRAALQSEEDYDPDESSDDQEILELEAGADVFGDGFGPATSAKKGKKAKGKSKVQSAEKSQVVDEMQE